MEEVNRLWVTEAFIRLLVQLQDRAIWAIPDKKVVTSGAYTVLQHFEIMPQRKPGIGEDALYFQIHHTEISVYIDLLKETDLIEFLPDSILFIEQKENCEILAAFYKGLFCISDRFLVDETFLKQCEEANLLFQNLYIPLNQELLIKIFSQLPDGAVLAIDSWELEDCSAFQSMKQFRLQEKFTSEQEDFSYCFRIGKADLPVYIDWIRCSDLPSFLIHFVIFPSSDSEDKAPLAVVYDSCIFCLSDKIEIEQQMIEQADKVHLYVQKL